MYVVYIARAAQPRGAAGSALALASALGVTEYEVCLALAVPPPAILVSSWVVDTAEEAARAARAAGHDAYVFDDARLVPSEDMIAFEDFRTVPDGIRRERDGAFLPHGDVYAVLLAVHELTSKHVQGAYVRAAPVATPEVVTRHEDREHVAYFFRRSGERPWLLRERHTRYDGLGEGRGPTARGNFTGTLARFREAAPMAVFDDRLLRRPLARSGRLGPGGSDATRHYAADLLAHLLATTIASQGGSPYR